MMTTHLRLVSRQRMSGAISLLPFYAFLAWTGKTSPFFLLINLIQQFAYFLIPSEWSAYASQTCSWRTVLITVSDIHRQPPQGCIKVGDHAAWMTKLLWWCLMFVGLRCGTCLMSLFWWLECWGSTYIFFLNLLTPVTSLSFKCFHHFVTVLRLLQYNELPFLCESNQFL